MRQWSWSHDDIVDAERLFLKLAGRSIDRQPDSRSFETRSLPSD